MFFFLLARDAHSLDRFGNELCGCCVETITVTQGEANELLCFSLAVASAMTPECRSAGYAFIRDYGPKSNTLNQFVEWTDEQIVFDRVAVPILPNQVAPP